jgi:hypothetical protein
MSIIASFSKRKHAFIRKKHAFIASKKTCIYRVLPQANRQHFNKYVQGNKSTLRTLIIAKYKLNASTAIHKNDANKK